MPSLMHAVSASSIGPPMMKKMSLTPCAFTHRARISLPVSSAISVSPLLVIGSDHPFFTQRVDVPCAHPEPFAKDLGAVLSQQWSRCQLWRTAVEPPRPGRPLEGAGRGFRDLHDAALGPARLGRPFPL